MLTCFIKSDFNNPGKQVAVYSLLLIPLFYVIYAFYAFIIILRRRNVQTDREFKIAIIKYLLYSILYVLFYFPSIILYIFSIGQNILPGTFLSYFSYFCTLSTISINLFLCLFRIFEGYVKCHWKALFVNHNLDDSLISEDPSEYTPGTRKNSVVDERRESSINITPKRNLSLWKKVESDMIKGVKLYAF
jgi:hypothetical protein